MLSQVPKSEAPGAPNSVVILTFHPGHLGHPPGVPGTIEKARRRRTGPVVHSLLRRRQEMNVINVAIIVQEQVQRRVVVPLNSHLEISMF